MILGGIMQRKPAMARAVAANPNSSGERKYAMSNVAPAVAALFRNHCVESQNDPRNAESVSELSPGHTFGLTQ